jgi:hypothetical protein
MFTDTLPSNGRHTVARVYFRGNVFTETLPSSGYTRHIMLLDILHSPVFV